MKTHFYFTIFAFILLGSTHFVNAQTYCNPTYSNGCGSWKITKVTIPEANFNDSSFTSCGQTNKTATIITMNTGGNYNINVTTIGWIACGMAIDFNQNGSFDDAGEALFLPGYIANDPQTYSGNFSIPSTLASGNYRMRIWNREANAGVGNPAKSACGTYGYGTWVDYTVTISSTALATSETSLSKAKVYPNPVSDVLNIENSQTIKSVEIYDLNGKLLKSDFSLNKKNVAIKLSNLTPGAYTAKITNTKGIEVIKFLKK